MGSVVGSRELRDSWFKRASLVLAVNGMEDCRGGREGGREKSIKLPSVPRLKHLF